MDRVLIIAEAGVNHNGNMDLARSLIDKAATAGADYVKFQTFRAERLVTRSAEKAAYQRQSSNEKADGSQYDMLKKLELDVEAHRLLMAHCRQQEIGFLSTAFDLESIDVLSALDIPFFKIPSGEITNLPYLEKIAGKHKPVILSTGMAEMEEVRAAVKVLVGGDAKENITVLHCNTAYPTPYEDVNLRAMVRIREELGVKVGYSDHTPGIEVAVAAVALGAMVIEKHLTLDKTMEGPDHAASLEPDEFTAMVSAIRNIEMALGNSEKKPSPSELENKRVARKSIHLARPVKRGDVIQAEDLIMKRPEDGISPMEIYQMIGRRVNKDLLPDQSLNWEDLG